MGSQLLRRIFKLLNTFFMAPLFRLGLGPFVGNPVTGYIMVLKTIGRKTGKVRYTPVNYAIHDGKVYCLAGFGSLAHWYRNLQAHPRLEVILPSGPMAGVAEDVTGHDSSLQILRQIMKNAGFAGLTLGFNPFTVSDDLLREKTRGIPVICIRPTGVGSGAGDSGGWLWVLLVVVLALWLVFN